MRFEFQALLMAVVAVCIEDSRGRRIPVSRIQSVFRLFFSCPVRLAHSKGHKVGYRILPDIFPDIEMTPFYFL